MHFSTIFFLADDGIWTIIKHRHVGYEPLCFALGWSVVTFGRLARWLSGRGSSVRNLVVDGIAANADILVHSMYVCTTRGSFR